MKILQLGKFYPIRGGVEKVMYDLTVGLSAQGVDCDMMCAAAKGGSRTVQLNEHARLLCLRAWAKVAATMVAPGMIFSLRKRCNEYDIIHVHHPDPMACLALRLSGYKGRVILHWHSDILKQKRLLRLYFPLQEWLLKRAELILGTTPIYLVASPFLQEVQTKTACLPIGVETVPATVAQVDAIRSRYPGKKIVFSLGRFVTYKGFVHLIRAARYLTEEYVVLIGGTGPLWCEMMAEIETWGLEDKVKLLGSISDEHLPAYYAACTLFCLPSVQKTEAFGIVQIEAMSFGKPVVATSIPGSGVAWVNEQGVSGLNVPPCDAEALANAVMEIGDDEETYRRFSRNALERYRSMFTSRQMIDKCLTYYNYGNE